MCDDSLPDMVIVHSFKERVSFDLLHSSGSNPVFTLTAEPGGKQQNIRWKQTA